MELKGNISSEQKLKGKITAIPQLDETLTKHGYSADAKATGEAIAKAKSEALAGSRPNTWLPTIAQIGAAPAGYGYGETLEVVEHSSEASFETLLNNELATMTDKQSKQIAFSCSGGLYGGTTYFGTLTRNTSKYAVLFGYSADNVCVFKAKGGGVWTPFEWENPPMVLDVEYRTTERWQGKAVYTKLLDFGTLPNTTAKYITYTEENTTIVGAQAIARRTSDGFVKPIPFFANGGGCEMVFEVNPSTKKVAITTLYDCTAFTGEVTLRYVKN